MKRITIAWLMLGMTLLAAPAFAEKTLIENIRARVGINAVSEERYSEIEEERENEPQNDDGEIVAIASNYYYYDYTLQYLETMGLNGSSLILGDGSIWITRPSDGYKIQHWSDYYSENVEPAQLYLTTNNNWIFGKDYQYRVVNKMTGESTLVNFSQPPFQASSFYIWNIDYYSGIIELLHYNGTYVSLQMSAWDSGVYADWKNSDCVILGRNTRWNASSNPYLIINITTMTNARASAG